MGGGMGGCGGMGHELGDLLFEFVDLRLCALE